MTQDEIIRFAIQCRLVTTGNRDGLYMDALIEFANLVAAKEREACAQIADERSVGYPHPSRIIAAAIRARGAGICTSIGEAVSQLENKHETNLHLRQMQTPNSDNHCTMPILRR